jgi:hypothetical protein
MGGDLAPPASDGGAPVFSVWALRDPGTEASPGAPLQRIQIVKAATTDDDVEWHVYDVAGDPDNGAGVDTRTCERSGEGFDELCRVWRDPDFDRDRPALYYARVVENPSCRWTAWACNANGVDCRDPKTAPGRLAACCAPDLRKTIQERAWTSPIWYAPESAARGAAADTLAPSRPQSSPTTSEDP